MHVSQLASALLRSCPEAAGTTLDQGSSKMALRTQAPQPWVVPPSAASDTAVPAPLRGVDQARPLGCKADAASSQSPLRGGSPAEEQRPLALASQQPHHSAGRRLPPPQDLSDLRRCGLWRASGAEDLCRHPWLLEHRLCCQLRCQQAAVCKHSWLLPPNQKLMPQRLETVAKMICSMSLRSVHRGTCEGPSRQAATYTRHRGRIGR